jgi:integrase
MPRRARGEGSVYKRVKDGRWVATLPLGRDGMGKRIRRVFYGRTRQQALATRKAFQRDLEEGLVSARAARARRVYTVGTWLDYWLEARIAQDREPTTYAQYETAARLHIKPALGTIPLAELEADDVEAWLRTMQQDGVGARTRQVALTRLRTALNFALERRAQTGLRYNAAALVSMPANQRPKVAAPNLENARRLLQATHGHRLEATVTVGLSLGLRRGEVIGLKWEDIDLEQRIVCVRRRVTRVGHRLLVREGTKMDAEAAETVAIPDLLVQALQTHRTRQLEERLKAGARWKGPEPTIGGKPAGFVFTSTVGTVLEPRNVYRWWETVRLAAGLNDKTFHQLRHDCASLLLAQGVPMYAVSQILRHSSPAITARFYAHLTPELQREAAASMDRLLSPLVGRS